MGGGAGVGGAWPGGVLLGRFDGREPRPRSRRATATRDSRCSPATQLDEANSLRRRRLSSPAWACGRLFGLSPPAWLVMAGLACHGPPRLLVINTVSRCHIGGKSRHNDNKKSV